MNTAIAPFDNVNLRKAVVAGDRPQGAAADARRRIVAGDIATHFLAPTAPGLRRAAGGVKGPDLDFLANPSGDLTVAAKYMKAAGFPSGKYTGPRDLDDRRQLRPGGQDGAGRRCRRSRSSGSR